MCHIFFFVLPFPTSSFIPHSNFSFFNETKILVFWKMRQRYWQNKYFQVVLCNSYTHALQAGTKISIVFFGASKKQKRFSCCHLFLSVCQSKDVHPLKEEGKNFSNIHFFHPYEYYWILMFLWKRLPETYHQCIKFLQYNFTMV